jgi:xylulokinase
MTRVAGVDSSTQACKVVVRDADSGTLVRSGRAAHPDGTEVAPQSWWEALQVAVENAGGLDDVSALSVAGQQHGMVTLDEEGHPVRDALLWNDTRSAADARDLILEMGQGDERAGGRWWAEKMGSVPVASLTVSKLRWLARNEPGNAERVAAVALPHDWLTWKLAGSDRLEALATDRSDASGTGYWSPLTGEYDLDMLERALRHRAVVPQVLGPADIAGHGATGSVAGLGAHVVLGPGAGDNAAAALALGLGPGDVVLSIGTSGVVSALTETPVSDPSGMVTGFADATGRFLPLCTTLNASRVLDAACRILSVDHDELSRLALSAPPGAEGLVLVPYLEGERTPNRPDATGALHGLRLANATPANIARAAVEGMLCGLADGVDELRRQGVAVERLVLVGGGARSRAVREIAPMVFGVDVAVPPVGEYVADGAARQAAWVLSESGSPPPWSALRGDDVHTVPAVHGGEPVRHRYREVRDLTPPSPTGGADDHI